MSGVRMDSAHRRLWTDVVRLAQPGYAAAPASLLALAAWQSGSRGLRPKDASEADVTPITMQFSC